MSVSFYNTRTGSWQSTPTDSSVKVVNNTSKSSSSSRSSSSRSSSSSNNIYATEEAVAILKDIGHKDADKVIVVKDKIPGTSTRVQRNTTQQITETVPLMAQKSNTNPTKVDNVISKQKFIGTQSNSYNPYATAFSEQQRGMSIAPSKKVGFVQPKVSTSVYDKYDQKILQSEKRQRDFEKGQEAYSKVASHLTFGSGETNRKTAPGRITQSIVRNVGLGGYVYDFMGGAIIGAEKLKIIKGMQKEGLTTKEMVKREKERSREEAGQLIRETAGDIEFYAEMLAYTQLSRMGKPKSRQGEIKGKKGVDRAIFEEGQTGKRVIFEKPIKPKPDPAPRFKDVTPSKFSEFKTMSAKKVQDSFDAWFKKPKQKVSEAEATKIRSEITERIKGNKPTEIKPDQAPKFEIKEQKSNVPARVKNWLKETKFKDLVKTQHTPLSRRTTGKKGSSDIVEKGNNKLTDPLKDNTYKPIEPRKNDIIKDATKDIIPKENTDLMLKDNIIKDRPRDPWREGKDTKRVIDNTKTWRIPPFKLPDFGIGSGGGGGLFPRYNRKVNIRGLGKGYSPSLTAETFKIYGSKPSKLTGLELRPLIGKDPYKEKFKKKFKKY